LIVDAYDLNRPEVGKSILLLPPLRDIDYIVNNQASINATATQDIYLLMGYDGATKYAQLPLGDLEGKYQTLGIRLVNNYKEVTLDLNDLTFVSHGSPVTVDEVGDQTRDWVIKLHWIVDISFAAEPEVGTVQPPFTINGIGGGIYSAKRDLLTDNRLDFRFTLGNAGD
jgi:hypothetical protein